jgi:O-antigen ligase
MKGDIQFAGTTFAHRWWPASAWAPVIFGLLAAIAITQNSWAALAVLAAIPMVLILPVEFAFGLLALAVPFDAVTGIGGSTFTVSFLVSAAAGGILLVRMLAGNGVGTLPNAAKWFFVFFAWSAMSTLWALHPQLSNLRLPAAASLIALYLVAVSVRITDREFERIGALVILGGTIAAAVSLLQFARGINVAGRASIVFGQAATNSNELAASLILPLSLAVGGVMSHRGLKRLLLVGASMLLLACTFLTMSRGALVALAVMVAVYFHRRGVDKRLLALLAGGALLVAFAPDLLRTRMQESMSSRAQGRWDIWLVGFEVVKHHGLFGVGLDNFPVAFQEYAGRQQVFRTFSVVPHNIYLQAIAETGILGLFLLVGAFRTQVRDLARAVGALKDSSRTLITSYEAAAWAILTHALVANLLWRKVFWFNWILIAVSVQVARRCCSQSVTNDPLEMLKKKGERSSARLDSVSSTPY